MVWPTHTTAPQSRTNTPLQYKLAKVAKSRRQNIGKPESTTENLSRFVGLMCERAPANRPRPVVGPLAVWSDRLGIMSQRVLITAGAAGIGREFARAFTANGAKVFVCDIDDKALAAI